MLGESGKGYGRMQAGSQSLDAQRRGLMKQAVSLDNGLTWSPFEPNGLDCIVVPNRLIPLSGNRHMGVYSDDEYGFTIVKCVTRDGGQTWPEERVIARHPDAQPAEPGIIVSPDGKQIAVVMREQSRAYNSLIITSDDEGETWSDFRELSAGLTGDRHNLAYAPDGRLVAVFRDTCLASPTSGDFLAWVGTYDDLVNCRDGQYRVRLLDNRSSGGNTGYAGLEVLPDGTLVATTYCVLEDGEAPLIVSVRFKMEELDSMIPGT